MKDLIKRSLISIVSCAFLWYVVYMFLQDIIIVQWNFFDSNMLFYLLLVAAWLFLFIWFWIYPISIKRSKLILFFFGIGFIIIGEYVLLNDVRNNIFIWDVVKVFWVLITLLAPTNILITSKIKEKKNRSNLEVIDA